MTQKEKTHWRKVFNSDYLGSVDLEPGSDLKAIIKFVQVKPVKGTDGKEKDCNVATFTDARIKPMILNATNCRTVKGFVKSPFIDDWNNVPVAIYVKDDVKAFGEITEGLRIRSVQPTIQKPKLVPGTEIWDKAKKFLEGGGKFADIKARYSMNKEDEKTLSEVKATV